MGGPANSFLFFNRLETSPSAHFRSYAYYLNRTIFYNWRLLLILIIDINNNNNNNKITNNSELRESEFIAD